jgi:hypothetical protein
MLVLALPLLVAAAAPARVLVLNLEAIGVDANVSRSVDALVLQGAQSDGVEVLSEAEIKKLADLEANKQEIGCNASSCLAELADAMGAQLVLFGSVSQLGSVTTVSLSLFDHGTTQVRRDTLSAQNVGELPALVPSHVHALLAASLPKSAATEAPAPETGGGPSPLFLAGVGGAVVGALALAGGAVGAGVMEARIQDPKGAGADKSDAQLFGKLALGAALAGAVIAGAGAAVIVVAE